ncbi:MAG: ROK family protein [Bacteroidetes bacterium]|jgi:glucokinase|nr:ROK family protein [Bacteroidota bacterium]
MSSEGLCLGVDIGGTNTVLGLVDASGRLMGESSISTCAHQPATQLFDRLHKAATVLGKSLSGRWDLRGIGIGAPNANYYRGTIEQPPNLSWDHVDVVSEMSRFFKVPVAVTNDANAAALGEMLFGSARSMKDFIVVTLGTGLGSGIVANGQLVYGADGFAGEMGHTIAVPGGRECGCGRRGCLEAYASANGVRRTVHELIASTMEASELRDVPFNELTAKRVAESAARGDRLALETFDRTARWLAASLADAVAYFSPQAIILVGGVASAGDLLLKPVKRYLEANVLSVFKDKVAILPSGLANGNTAVLGAGALIWNELKAGPKGS